MSTIELTPESVSAYATILNNPSEYGFLFPPLKECFEVSDKVIAKHILFQEYLDHIKNRLLPKIIFYIIMDELYGPGDGKDEQGFLGWKLKIKPL